MSVKWFVRIPAFDNPSEAIAYCRANGLRTPLLHGMFGAPGVVGSAQVDEEITDPERAMTGLMAVAGDLKKRGAALERDAKAVR